MKLAEDQRVYLRDGSLKSQIMDTVRKQKNIISAVYWFLGT